MTQNTLPFDLSTLSAAQLDQLAQQLTATNDFKVLKRLPARLDKPSQDLPENTRIGLILDTETTGLEATDKVLELGIVAFAYDSVTGQVLGIVDEYCGLEDPGFLIPEDSPAARVNGITNEMVSGKRFDDNKVLGLLSLADLVIAHKADFDRVMVEERFPEFANVAWGCSLKQIDWSGLGYGTAKLEYLLLEAGYFFEAHRASEDCHALLQLLAMKAPGQERTHFSLLLDKAFENGYRLWAEGAPFAAKDLLRTRGYRWSGGDAPGSYKAWFIDLPSDEALKEESEWLRANVFRREYSLPLHQTDALSRFSTRQGTLKRHYVND